MTIHPIKKGISIIQDYKRDTNVFFINSLIFKNEQLKISTLYQFVCGHNHDGFAIYNPGDGSKTLQS